MNLRATRDLRHGGASGAPGDQQQPSDAQRLADLTARRAGRHPVAVGLVVGAILAAAAAFLIAQNTQTVSFDWLWVSFDASLWAVLLDSFLAGAVASPLVGIGLLALRRRRRRFGDLVDSVRGEPERDASPPRHRAMRP
jgi:uncharacterized integral membrane protein